MTTPEQRRISILVPIYNEGKTLAEVIRRVGAVEVYGLEKEIILVDPWRSRQGDGGLSSASCPS